MRGLPQKQNARRADKIKLCGHLRRYKKIVKKTYIICYNISNFDSKVHFKVHSVPFAYSRGRGSVKGKEKYNAVAEVRGG